MESRHCEAVESNVVGLLDGGDDVCDEEARAEEQAEDFDETRGDELVEDACDAKPSCGDVVGQLAGGGDACDEEARAEELVEDACADVGAAGADKQPKERRQLRQRRRVEQLRVPHLQRHDKAHVELPDDEVHAEEGLAQVDAADAEGLAKVEVAAVEDTACSKAAA